MIDNPSTFPLLGVQKSFLEYELREPTDEMRRMYVCGNVYLDEKGPFDADAMERAYFEVLRRNDVFRIQIFMRGKQCYQRFRPIDEGDKPTRRGFCSAADLKEYYSSIQPPAISALADHLNQAEICSCEDGTGGIILWFHHICTDGWTMDQVVLNQLCECYDAYRRGDVPPEPKRLFSIKKCISDEQAVRTKRILKDFFWQWKQYNRHIFRYGLPYHRYPPKASVAFYTRYLEKNQWDRFADFCQEQSCSVTTALSFIVALMAYRHFHVRRFPIQTVSHGRSTYALKQTAGPLHDVQPVFYEIDLHKAVKNCLQEQQEQIIEHMKHISFGYVVEYFGFQGLINLLHCGYCAPHDWLYVNNMLSNAADDDHSLRTVVLDNAEDYPCFALLVCNEADQIRIDLQYNTTLVRKDTLTILEKEFFTFFERIMQFPDAELCKILSAADA